MRYYIELRVVDARLGRGTVDSVYHETDKKSEARYIFSRLKQELGYTLNYFKRRTESADEIPKVGRNRRVNRA